MSSFCTKCGRKLEDGEVCNCQSGAVNNSIPQPQQFDAQSVTPAQPSAVGVYLKRLYNSYVAIFRAPVTAGKAFVASCDYKLAIGFIVLQAIIVAIYGLCFELKIGIMLNKLMSYANSKVSMPYGSVIFGTLFFSAAFSFALAGILLAANMIFKNSTNYKAMLCSTALRSVVILPVAVVAMIVTFINPFAGMIVFFSANIWGVILITMTMPVANEKVANLTSLALFIAFFVFMAVCMYIMYKVSGMYISSQFKSMFDLDGLTKGLSGLN